MAAFLPSQIHVKCHHIITYLFIMTPQDPTMKSSSTVPKCQAQISDTGTVDNSVSKATFVYNFT